MRRGLSFVAEPIAMPFVPRSNPERMFFWGKIIIRLPFLPFGGAIGRSIISALLPTNQQ